jgi:predicted lipoprotein with Yx(FWY)xxD motif
MKYTGSLVVIAGAGLFAASAFLLSNGGTSRITGLAASTTTCVSGSSTAPLSEGAPMSKTRVLAALAAAAGLAVTACGSDDPSPTASSPSGPPPSAVASSAPAVEGETVSVKAATSPLGQILVDPDGRTLYAFTNDTQAQSTCTGTCAEAWPPLRVADNWTVAPGLDAGVFSTIIRDDGTLQLAAGQFPLYYFSGDARPGDVNGQGSGNVWFVVDTGARVVTDGGAGAAGAPPAAPAPAPGPAPAAPAAIAKSAESPLGVIVVDGSGRTLYGFTEDGDGTPTCVDACANAWPPVIVEGAPTVEGLDQALFTTVDRPDGTKQLKMGKWPLYTFSGDAAPGDVNGQGSGGSWFVVAPDGKLVK